MKKKLAIILAAVCIICAGAAGIKLTSTASTASIDITAQAESVEKEQIVEVQINVSSDVCIGYINSLISYDDTVLEYVSDSDDAAAGASGTINILDTFAEGTYDTTYVLKFKALEVGQCQIVIDEAVIEEFETTNVMDASTSSVTVTVETNNSVSSESRLSDLLIAPANVDETFDSDIYEYHAAVGVETEQIMLSAIPADDDAVVTINMPDTLSIGENKIVITVTALSGDYSEYVIYVNRLQTALPESDASDADVETEAIDDTAAVDAMDAAVEEDDSLDAADDIDAEEVSDTASVIE